MAYTFSSRRPALTLVEIIAAVGAFGLLTALTVGSILSATRLKEERAIQENLQTVWSAANEYFLQNNISETETAELFSPDAGIPALRSVKTVRSEDYTQINGGKISAADAQLTLSYQSGGDTLTAVYSTTK